MQTIIIVVHVIVAIAIVGLVLLQQGKGADAGASFGSGSSQTVFGSSGSGSFLVRATTVAATIFFITSMSLAIFARNQAGAGLSTDIPIVNEAILQEQQNDNNDVPQIDASQADTPDDVPALPN